MPSYFENCCPRLSPNLMGFSAGIMVACSGPYHLQFLESSYSWNREEPSITLKPQLYPDLERVEEEAMNYLVIIQVLSSINNNQPCKFLLELPSRFYSPPIEIKEGRVHMFHWVSFSNFIPNFSLLSTRYNESIINIVVIQQDRPYAHIYILVIQDHMLIYIDENLVIKTFLI